MPWSAETLRDLIRPQCDNYKIRPEELVPDNASMRPRQALDLVADRMEFGDE
jgi:transposase